MIARLVSRGGACATNPFFPRQSKVEDFEKIVFGFKGRHISNRAKVRKPITHFIRGEANVLPRGHPYPE
jgi:hypothetical protein